MKLKNTCLITTRNLTSITPRKKRFDNVKKKSIFLPADYKMKWQMTNQKVFANGRLMLFICKELRKEKEA